MIKTVTIEYLFLYFYISPIVNHFLLFDYIIKLIHLDILEVKWLSSHIVMSYVEFNRSIDTNYLEGEKRKWVFHLFRRLVNLFHLYRRLVKPFHLFRRIFKIFHLFKRLVKPFHLFRRSVKPFHLFRRLVNPFYLFRWSVNPLYLFRRLVKP